MSKRQLSLVFPSSQAASQTSSRRPLYFQLSTLVLFGFATIFYPRVLSAMKFPSIVNLVHLGLVPLICILVLVKTKVKKHKQIAAVWELLVALVIFFGVHIASALLNGAGEINALVNYIMLAEHFMFLAAIAALQLTPAKLPRFRAFLVFASFSNIAFAYVQQYVLRLHLKEGLADNIKGVFIGQGAGHVIGASVALTIGIYYFADAKKIPLSWRVVVALSSFWHLLMADAKQVLLAFGVAGGLLLLTKFDNFFEALKYLIGGTLLVTAFIWCMQNVPAFGAFNTWMRPEIYGPEGEATLLKSATFRVVPQYYESWLHPWLGLGPGHTVGRLGGWMLSDYSALLSPLGSTRHPASSQVWQAVGASWLGDQSSMFSPLFGWAGIWGDLGWLGVASLLYIWWVVWRRFCFDDISRFLVLTPLVFGLIFTQMEEPGYMCYVTTIIGLRWQQRQCQRQAIQQAQQLENQPQTLPPIKTNQSKRRFSFKLLWQRLLLYEDPRF
jgi:hypothetical protein